MDFRINEAVRQYAKRVNEKHKPKAIYLYGSQAKGTADEYSDIDIAFVFASIGSRDKYLDIFSDISIMAADYEINIEPNLLEDDGEYDRFSFLAEVIETGKLIEI